MPQNETVKLALTVNFSIELEDEQSVKVLFQRTPIHSDYELDLVNTFSLDQNGKVDKIDLESFIADKCLSYINVETDIGKILDKINYSINLKNVNYRTIN